MYMELFQLAIGDACRIKLLTFMRVCIMLYKVILHKSATIFLLISRILCVL